MLVEPDISQHIAQSLQQCHVKRTNVYYIIFNVFAILAIIAIFGINIYLARACPPVKRNERIDDKVFASLRQMRNAKLYDKMISDLPVTHYR